jgi:hypothetical protein
VYVHYIGFEEPSVGEIFALWCCALWKDCDIEALWHEPRFQRVAFWHRAALAIMLAQPSSAPIERVFSALRLLKTVHVVGDNQGRGLSDYQSESMMIYYNSRERARR